MREEKDTGRKHAAGGSHGNHSSTGGTTAAAAGRPQHRALPHALGPAGAAVPPLQALQTQGHCHTAQIAPHGGTAAQPAARTECNAPCGSSLVRLWMNVVG